MDDPATGNYRAGFMLKAAADDATIGKIIALAE
jgi:hypothetical protein